MKKLWPFLLFIPFSAGAALPILALLGAGATAIAGFMIYRTLAPVRFADAADYFGSCWSCGMFGDIIGTLSDLIPKIYSALAENIIPISIALLFVWFAWRIFSDYIQMQAKESAWKYAGDLTTRAVRLAFVAALLAFPLPRFMNDTFVAPIMNVGLSLSNSSRTYIDPSDQGFNECLVASAIADKASPDGVYSPKLRNNITCRIAEFHRITGLGMATGWSFMQMAFSADYAYAVVIPNIGFILAGLTIFLMFLWALLPVPLYFLEVFIKLSMDLIMLPLLLMSWLFKDWDLIKLGGGGIKGIIDDVAKNTCGIALVGLFSGFAVLFLNAAAGSMSGIGGLAAALKANDATYLINAIQFNNSGLIDIIFLGLFVGMFMNAIPKLVTQLFSGVSIPDHTKIQSNIQTILKDIKDGIGKKIAAAGKANS
ncbi:MAG: hypothetical protein LBL46_04920 [Rickettsiales bacterium]|nr:hypothetical protein [Rickettsiales bacterium]